MGAVINANGVSPGAKRKPGSGGLPVPLQAPNNELFLHYDQGLTFGVAPKLERVNDSGPSGNDFENTFAALQPDRVQSAAGAATCEYGINELLGSIDTAGTTWRFLHDGTGSTVIIAVDTTGLDVQREIMYSHLTVTSTDVGFVIRASDPNGLLYGVSTGTAWAALASAAMANGRNIITVRSDESLSTDWEIRVNGSVGNSGNFGATLATGDPTDTLKTGRTGGVGYSPAHGVTAVYSSYLSDEFVDSIERWIEAEMGWDVL